MKYNCIVVDDEPIARKLIETHLSHLEEFSLIGSFENALKAKSFLEKNKVDLIFLDIEMPLLKGIDFIKMTKNLPDVIFTTAYREYAIEGYELNVTDYLLKPITFERFYIAIEKFKDQKQKRFVEPSNKKDFILVPTSGKKLKLILSKITYIESYKDYVTIHLENNKSHHIKYSISQFNKLLNASFMRVHRSYIINLDKVSIFSKYEVEINNNTIPIGEKYRSEWDKIYNG